MRDTPQLIDLITTSHEIAKSKGWWDEEVDLDINLLNIFAEFFEAWEAARIDGFDRPIYTSENGKPEGLAVEFADMIIRGCDLLGYLAGPEDADVTALANRINQLGSSAPLIQVHLEGKTMAQKMHYLFGFLINTRMAGLDVEKNAIYFVAATYAFCDDLGLPVDEAIRLKISYNRTRSYRHGSKRA